ncbi:MAG: DsrE family protein [Mangrovibacterium sp.]|nr:DsrE family protein [Mangrovibacterium sp.]
MKRIIIFMLVILGAFFSGSGQNSKVAGGNSNKLAVIWTSNDPEVAEKVCFMYAQNAKKQGWFEEVVLIIWGPSIRLLAENDDLKADIIKIMDMGIPVEASLSCAQLYGVGPDLADLDIDVKPMGVPLTGYIKEGWKILTF